jgi:peptidyl-prolyl cis-trans isomerase D
MGLMESLRNSTKYILWVLILSFGVLWGLSDTQMFDAMMTGPRALGEVNGKPIAFEDYNNRLTSYLERYRQESDGEQPGLELRAFYEETVWDELVLERILETEMARLGITVTDSEVIDMVSGPNPDPFITQFFTAADGTVDRVALRAAIEAPENAEIWVNVERQLRDKRRREKLNAFLESGLVVTAGEVAQEYVRDNSMTSFRFVRFPYSAVDEATLTVDEGAIRDHYRKSGDAFKQEKSWNLRYVSFPKTPTAADTARVLAEAEHLKPLFSEAADDSTFLAQNGSRNRTLPTAFQSETELGSHLAEVFQIANGQVTSPVLHNGDVVMAKRVEGRGRTVRAVVFSMAVEADPFTTIGAQSDAANDFSAYAAETGFEAEATRLNLTVGTAFATKGTPFIPGLGQSRVLLNALERAKRGEVSEPVELDDQFVVFEVLEIREAGKRPLEEVKPQIEAQLRNDQRKAATAAQARQFLSGTTSIDALAALAGRELLDATDIRMTSNVIPGAGREPAVIGAAFAIAENTLSGVIEGENAAYVIHVMNRVIADASGMPEAASNQLRNRLQAQKSQTLRDVWLDRLKANAEIKDYRSLLLR